MDPSKKNSQKVELSDDDYALFDKMAKEYTSENERIFFEEMRFKQEYVLTFSNDLILHENDNEDEIYLVRMRWDEYLVGHGKEYPSTQEVHTMDLSEALALNLKELGFLDRDITLLEWLRERNYAGVQYDHNYDDT